MQTADSSKYVILNRKKQEGEEAATLSILQIG